MNYRLYLNYLSDQLDAALDAPVAIAVLVVLAALIAWVLVEWRYRRVIARLRQAVARKDRELRQLHSGADEGDAVRIEAEAQPDATSQRRDRQKALRKISNAIEAAEQALRSGDPLEAEAAMPAMGLALTAAQQAFALPVPAQTDVAAADLATSRRFLQHVRPALRGGDDETARDLASEFLRRHGIAIRDRAA